MTGNPRAITINDPEKTQSGSPVATIAACATIATTTKAAA
jgi:hypothetical protein